MSVQIRAYLLLPESPTSVYGPKEVLIMTKEDKKIAC